VQPLSKHQVGIALVAIMLVSCSRQQRRPQAGRASRADAAAIAKPTQLEWRSTALAPALEVDILGGNTSVYQAGGPDDGTLIAGDSPVRIGIEWGPTATLATWTAGAVKILGAVVGTETSGTICGRPARRLEVTIPGHTAHFSGPNGEGDSVTPTELMIAHAFQVGSLPVVAFYIVSAEERDRFANDEMHFLTSIKCSP